MCLSFLAFCLSLLILLVTLSLVYTNYDNYVWFESFGTIGVALLTLFLVSIFFRLADIKRILGHFSAVMKEKETFETITILSFSTKPMSLDDSTKVFEVKAKNHFGNEKTYYVLALFECGFEIGKTYEVALSSNFIKEIKNEL